MRKLLLGLIALACAGAAQAATPVPVLFSPTAPHRVLQADFNSGTYSANGIPAASFTALPGASFSRSGTATVTAVRGDGTIKLFPARTNLVTYSQLLSAGTWTSLNAQIGSSAVAPDGTNTAQYLQDANTNNANHLYYTNSFSITAGGTYTISAYFLAKEYNQVTLQIRSGSFSGGLQTTATLTGAGTVAGSSNSGGSITNTTITALPNGWYRVTATGIVDSSSTSALVEIYLKSSTYTGVVGSGAYVWGVQAEAGSTATAYIPTTGSAVTVNDPRITGPSSNTNAIPNSTMVGATSSSLPTGWSATTSGGITPTVVGTGTENGFAYVDVQYSGTPTANGYPGVATSGATIIPALPGQTWTASVYVRVSGGSLTNVAASLQEIVQSTSSGAYITNTNSTFTPTATMSRVVWTNTLSGATTAYVNQWVGIQVASGQAINLTLRIYAPQLNPDPVAKPFVPTTTAPVTVDDFTAVRTNLVRNSSMSGAVTGTPGTLPTNWSLFNGPSLSYSVVGTGSENGANYFDLRVYGTPANSNPFNLYTDAANVALTPFGQTFNASANIRMVAGSTTNISSIQLVQGMNNSSGTWLSNSGSITLPLSTISTVSRYSFNSTISNSATVYGNTFVAVNGTSGQAIDITLRISAPQLEPVRYTSLTYPTAYIPTTTAAVSVYDTPLASMGVWVGSGATNSFPNSTMVGATSSSAPTGWGVSAVASGITPTVAGTGVENGTPYLDVTFAGTATGTSYPAVTPVGPNVISAASGQTWTNSVYARLVSGTVPSGIYFDANIAEYSSGGAYLVNSSSAYTLTNVMTRFSTTRTLNNASTAFIYPYFFINVSSGQTLNFTIRFYAPQVEQGAFATTFIPTTNSAVTAGADVLSVSGNWLGAGNWSWLVDVAGLTPNQTGLYPNFGGFDDGSVNNTLAPYVVGGANYPALVYSVGGSGLYNSIIQYAPQTTFRIGVSNIAGKINAAINGSMLGVITPWISFSPSKLEIGEKLGSTQCNCFIRRVDVYQGGTNSPNFLSTLSQ